MTCERRHSFAFRAAAALVACCWLVAPALGQQDAPRADAQPTTRAAAAAAAADPEKAVQVIDLTVGQSRIIDVSFPAKRVPVSDPRVADVDMTTPRRIQLQGKSVGSAEVTVWSETGEAWQARLEVRADLSRMRDQLRKLFNNGSIDVVQADEVTVLQGTLARAEDAAQLRELLQMLNVKYLDRTTVAGLQQVQLQVKVAEVSRTAIRMLGINAVYGGEEFFGGVQIGSSAGPFTPMNIGLPGGQVINGPTSAGRGSNLPFVVGQGGISVPPTATLFAGFPNSDLQLFLQALAENQYLRILAEPTLVARSGQEARFLAGGQFPIPVANLSGAGATQISIEYKDFGIQLQFTPVVLGNGRIQLKVAPEVSQLSDVGAVSVLGTRVPSVLTRRVETMLELQTGQTFAVAGLINQNDSATASRVPGIGDLPVLGAFFRNVRYSRNDTEILVLVTASLVEPTSSELDPPVPGSFHVEPNDWELYIDGKIEGRARARIAPAQQERLKRYGLDKLQGPGAWATYDGQPNTLAAQRNSTTTTTAK